MGTRVFGAGLLLLAAAVAGLCWLRDDPAPPAADAEPPPAPAPDPDIVAAPAAQRAESDAPDEFWLNSLSGRGEALLAADDDPHAVTLRGRLTVRQRPWLHPAGVELRLVRSWLDTLVPTDAGAQDELAPTFDDPVSRTDGEGRFAFRFRPTSGELFFLVDRGGPWNDFQRVHDVPRLGEELDLGDVFVDDRGGVTGRVVILGDHPIRDVVVRAVDAPLADATTELDELRTERNRHGEKLQVPGSLAAGPLPAWAVRRDRFLPFPTATTDAGGRFRLRGLRPGTHDLFLQSTYGSGRLLGVQVAVQRDTDVGDVRLGRTFGRVDLRFVDEHREPWVGAAVALLDDASGFGAPIAHTDARGQARGWVTDPFRIAFAFPGGGPWLSLPPRGQPPLPPPSGLGQSQVIVPRPADVTIALTDLHGASITGGRIRLYATGEAFRPVDRELPAALQPRERRPGSYVGRTPLPVVAVAVADGFAPAVAPVRPGSRVKLTMLPLQRVTVRVRDSDGLPVAGAAVRVQVHGTREQSFAGAQWAALANDRILAGYTDEDGALEVPVWDTEFSFAADHPDYAPSPGPRLRPLPGQEVGLMLRRTATLRGQLSFQRRPAPAGFRLRAQLRPPGAHELAGSGWLAEHLAVTGEDGSFAFRGLCAGIWHVTPELPSVPGVAGPEPIERLWQTTRVALEEGQEVYRVIEAELEELEAPQLTGTVSIDGMRLGDALVRVRWAGPEGGWYGRRPRQRLRTDAFGDFAFGSLEPGVDYELRVDVPDQGRLQFLHREVVRVPAPGAPPRRVDVAVESGALQIVCLQDDLPFRNRMLRLRQVVAGGDDGACWEVLTGAQGECRVDRLPAGTWTLEPVHGGRAAPAELTIAPGGLVSETVAVSRR